MNRITECECYGKCKLKRELTQEDINYIWNIEQTLEMYNIEVDDLENIITDGMEYREEEHRASKNVYRELKRVVKEFKQLYE